jgi:RNA 3'-terminal phosphate cyclase-like protein
MKLSPQVINRVIESARSLLNEFIPDVYIYTDAAKGAESGKSPGFGLSLVAESTTGVLLAAEHMSTPGDVPEDLGRKTAKLLYRQIKLGGCLDTSHQWLGLLMMVLSTEDVHSIVLGPLTGFTYVPSRDLCTHALDL